MVKAPAKHGRHELSHQTCQKTARRQTLKVSLVQLPIMFKPFQCKSKDVIVSFTPTNRVSYILAGVNYATMSPKAVPLKMTHSESVPDSSVDMLSRCGCNFVCKLITYFYKLIGTHQTHTSQYPQTDGLVERFNQTPMENH